METFKKWVLIWDKGNVEPKRSNIEINKIIVELKKLIQKALKNEPI